jgi:catechol 2,3-dioxygenase-like lactoylglutathione lyase family enzyme
MLGSMMRKTEGNRNSMNAFVHVGLTVSDIARSRRFYCGLLGFTYDRDLSFGIGELDGFLLLEPPSALHAVYLTLGVFTLELMHFEPASAHRAATRKFNETGLAHLSIAVDDPEQVVARVEEFGGALVSRYDPAVMIRDPDGQFIELLTTAYVDAIAQERCARSVQAE